MRVSNIVGNVSGTLDRPPAEVVRQLPLDAHSRPADRPPHPRCGNGTESWLFYLPTTDRGR